MSNFNDKNDRKIRTIKSLFIRLYRSYHSIVHIVKVLVYTQVMFYLICITKKVKMVALEEWQSGRLRLS